MVEVLDRGDLHPCALIADAVSAEGEGAVHGGAICVEPTQTVNRTLIS
jgi:hypothetical protein